MTWVAVAVGVGGALIAGQASKSAARTQAGAANQAGQLSQAQYEQTRSDLLPWMQSGQLALGDLNYLLGLGGSPGGGGAPTREQFTTRTPAQQMGGWQDVGNATGTQQVWRPGQFVPGATSFDQGGFDAATAAYAGQQAAQANDPRFGSLLQPFGLDDFQESPAYQFNLEQGLDAINKATRARGTNYAPATLQDIGKFSQGLASNEFLNAYNMYNQDQGNVFNRLFGVSGAGQNAASGIGAFGAGAAGQTGEAIMGAGNARAAGTIGQANAITGGLGDAYNAYLMSQILGQNQRPTYGAPSGGYSSQG